MLLGQTLGSYPLGLEGSPAGGRAAAAALWTHRALPPTHPTPLSRPLEPLAFFVGFWPLLLIPEPWGRGLPRLEWRGPKQGLWVCRRLPCRAGSWELGRSSPACGQGLLPPTPAGSEPVRQAEHRLPAERAPLGASGSRAETGITYQENVQAPKTCVLQ